MSRPRIFIGSSQEALTKEIPQKLQHHLSKWSDAETWDMLFPMSETTIESLERSLSDFDAYVIILTPDDIYKTRKETYVSARDNLLFEIGLAMGLKGRKNTFIIKQKIVSSGIKLPSDLLGVNFGEFSYSPDSINADLASLSDKIKTQYNEHHADKKTSYDTEDIREPIRGIQKTLESIGTTLKTDIEVLTGAEKTGIVNICPSRNGRISGKSLNDSIIKEFETTQDTICIQGITLSEYLYDRGGMHNQFMALIKRKSPCKVLIVGPRSKALVDRVYWEVGPEFCQDVNAFMKSSLYWDAVGSVDRASKLTRQYPKLEVRCYNQAPTCFLILTSKYAFTESYTYTSRGSNCPSLQILRCNGNYDLYKKHFDNLWESATPVEKYDLSHPINPDWFKYTGLKVNIKAGMDD